jgi:hypothetical protein
MITPVSISEQLLFATVRIQTTESNGDEGTGTGFFFNFSYAGKSVPTIVTNKHVVEGAVTGTFLFHEGEGAPTDKSIPVTLDHFQQQWFHHPTPSVDLCIMPFAPLEHQSRAAGHQIYRVAFDQNSLASDQDLIEMVAAQNVTMIGYPNGLWDTVNNLPLLRRGITASHPAIDFCGKPELVVDMACFPGSSGSPVVQLDEGWYFQKGRGSTAGSRMRFLGVLYAGPVMTADGEIIVEAIPTGAHSKTRTELMIHLGYVMKARELIVLGEHFMRAAERDGRLS